MHHIKINGYTLIELIVVIGVIGLTLPALFVVIFGILRQQVKIYALQEVKRQGDTVLSTMEDLIRNEGKALYSDQGLTNELCTTADSSTIPSSSLYLKDKQGNWFRFYLNGEIIASQSSVLNASTNLTNTKVKTTSFSLSCARTSLFSPPVVSVNFNLQRKTTSTLPQDIASFTYQTKIKLKNY